MLGRLFPLHLNKSAVNTPQHFPFSFKSLKRRATSFTFFIISQCHSGLWFCLMRSNIVLSLLSLLCLSFALEMSKLKSKIRKKIVFFSLFNERFITLQG